MSRAVAGAKMMDRAEAAAPADMGFAPALSGRPRRFLGGAIRGGEAVREGPEEEPAPLTRAAREQIRKVADKVFYRHSDGVFYDAEYDPKAGKTITEVTYLGDDYFELIDRHPAIAKYLAAGLEMVLCIDDQVYRIRK
jgi:hypothetical protein